MKTFSLMMVLSIAAVAAPVAAQDTTPDRIRMTPGPIPEAADDATREKVEAILKEASEAFRRAPAIMGSTSVEIDSGPMQNDLRVQAWFGANGAVRVKSPESEIVVKDGILNIVFDSIKDRYIRIPASQLASDDLETIFGTKFVAGYEILMREGQPWPVWLEALLMRSVGVPTITGLEEATTDDGTKVQRMFFGGSLGQGSVDYDPATKMILSATSSLRPMEGLASFSWTMNLKCSFTIMDALPEPISFDPQGRLPVATREDLDPVGRNRQEVGDLAPALQAATLDGTVFDLRKERGKTVVLAFWTTRSDISIKLLDAMDELYERWGRNSGNLLFYAVDVREAATTQTQAIDTASRYWSQNQLSLPTLVTVGDTVPQAWGLLSIPQTMVIDAEGVITQIQIGYGVRTKMEIEGLLKQNQKAADTQEQKK